MAAIADAYLGYLDKMRDLHLGIAGDYLVMAATLVHLKSISLLPRPPTSRSAEEEQEDPRESLVRRLVDYQRFKEASLALDARPHLGRDTFAREPVDLGDRPRPFAAGISAFALLDLYHDVLRRPKAQEVVHTVGGEGYVSRQDRGIRNAGAACFECGAAARDDAGADRGARSLRRRRGLGDDRRWDEVAGDLPW